MMGWEVFINETKKRFTNVCFDLKVKRRIMFRLRLRFRPDGVAYSSLSLKPDFLRTFWYSDAAFSKTSLLYERLDNRWLVIFGSCLRIFLGWLELLWTYSGISLGF